MSDSVTWLLPVKNGMPFLTETLASIAAQSYRNFEVLAWDNGSTDGTVEELQAWIPHKLPGRIVADRPLPLGTALAAMIEETATEWCARIDADDINLPERLENQIGYLKAHPEIALLGSQVNTIDENGVDNGRHGWAAPEHDDILHSLLVHNPIIHPSVVLRRSAILEVGNYRHLQDVEDYDLWLRLAARFKLANLPQTLLLYRQHPGSVTQKALKQKNVFPLLHGRLCHHAEELLGCSAATMKSLLAHEYSYAWPILHGIAVHLHKTQGKSIEERLHSPSFLHAARQFTSPADIRTRFMLARYDPAPNAVARELQWIAQGMVKRIAGRSKH